MTGRVLVLELNELSPPLIERFSASGHLPGFSRLYEQSSTWVTEAGEPQGRLNPWIQWVTAHTGVGYDEHGVFKLGEGHSLSQPTIADVVSASGRNVWLCGPMNVVPTAPVRGAWLPDPWQPDPEPVPGELEPFLRFVRTNVQEHTNTELRLSLRDYARFGWFMVRHGLSPSTVGAVTGQLVGERTRRVERYRRAALLDRFQWDVFTWYERRLRPAFASFFSNTTAHYQHLYWRHMDPEPFTLRPDEAEQTRFGDAIRFGYQEMDRLIGRALRLADNTGSVLVFSTAISQQPYLEADERGGKHFHRPHDIADLVQRLGLSGVEGVAPVMAEQFHLFLRTDEDAESADAALRGATVGDRPAFEVRRVGTDVFTGCSLVDEVPAEAVLTVPATAVSLPFHQHFYRSETAKSGYHHSQGALWVRHPQGAPRHEDDPVPLTAVAPTLLSLLGLPAPDSMRTPALDVVATP